MSSLQPRQYAVLSSPIYSIRVIISTFSSIRTRGICKPTVRWGGMVESHVGMCGGRGVFFCVFFFFFFFAGAKHRDSVARLFEFCSMLNCTERVVELELETAAFGSGGVYLVELEPETSLRARERTCSRVRIRDSCLLAREPERRAQDRDASRPLRDCRIAGLQTPHTYVPYITPNMTMIVF